MGFNSAFKVLKTELGVLCCHENWVSYVAMNEVVVDVFSPIQFSVVANSILVKQPVCVVTGLNEEPRALLLHSVKPVCRCRETTGYGCVGGRLHTALTQTRVRGKIVYVSQTIQPLQVATS
jgi:hypothetical protein